MSLEAHRWVLKIFSAGLSPLLSLQPTCGFTFPSVGMGITIQEKVWRSLEQKLPAQLVVLNGGEEERPEHLIHLGVELQRWEMLCN